MGYGDSTGLPGVVDEITLDMGFCLFSDDFYTVFIGAHRTIAAEAIKNCTYGCRGCIGMKCGFPGQTGMAQVRARGYQEIGHVLVENFTRPSCQALSTHLVVASHGRHGIRALLGSTTDGVSHAASFDVLAVRVDT